MSQVHPAEAENANDDEASLLWSEANENLVTYYALHAKHMMKKHGVMHAKTDWHHKVIMYPTIALSTVSGVVNYNDTHPAARYLTSSVSIISAILISYVKFMKLGELVEAHAKTAMLYKLLYRKMIGELLRDTHERLPASSFIQDISTQFDDLIKISPTIPDTVRVNSSGYNHWALAKLISEPNPRSSKTIAYRAFYRWKRFTVIRKIIKEDIEAGHMFSTKDITDEGEQASSKTLHTF